MKTESVGGAPIRLTTAGRGADPYRANLGLHVGDDPRVVHERRAALAADLGRAVVWMNQTHSTRVAVIRREGDAVLVEDETGARPLDGWSADELGPVDADALVIDGRGGVGAPAAAVMTADCVPVLLASGDGRIVAAVHAGRRGFEGGILTTAVETMVALGAASIRAVIGPAICGSCYEVPADMRDRVASTHPSAASTTSWGTPSLDLVTGARVELEAVGCRVEVDGRCTREDEELHSYRRNPGCGRQASVIAPA